jgi:hypothetical protein
MLQSVIQDKKIYILIEEALSLFFKSVRKSTLSPTLKKRRNLILSSFSSDNVAYVN